MALNKVSPQSRNFYRRRVALINPVAETSEYQIDLPRVQNYDAVYVELNAVFAVSVSGTAVRAEAPAMFIKTLQLIADGKDVLDDVPFKVFALGTPNRQFARNLTPPGNFTSGASPYTVRAVAEIPRASFNAFREQDTSFQAYLAQLFQLKFTTGLAADCFVGATASLTSANVAVYVVSHNEQTKPDGSSDQGEPKRVVKRSKQLVSWTGANSAYQVLLPIGNCIRRILLHVMNNTTNNLGEPTNLNLNNAKVSINDTDVRYNENAAAIRDQNIYDYELQAAALPTGIYVLDASPRGKFTEYWDMRGTEDSPVSRAVLELDLPAPQAGTGTIEVVVEEEIY